MSEVQREVLLSFLPEQRSSQRMVEQELKLQDIFKSDSTKSRSRESFQLKPVQRASPYPRDRQPSRCSC